MVKRDYTKELGLESGTRTVPLPIALVILAIVGALVWFGVTRMQAGASHAHSAGDAAATVAKPAATDSAHR